MGISVTAGDDMDQSDLVSGGSGSGSQPYRMVLV